MSKEKHPVNPVLLVDDEKSILTAFSSTLRSAGIDNIIALQDSRDVQPLLARQAVELVLLDLTMPHLPGEGILTWMAQEHPEVPVIVVTGANDVETAVTCIQAGALDFLLKPVDSSQFIVRVKQAIENRQLARENTTMRDRFLSPRLEHPQVFEKINTQNSVMHSIFLYLEMVAKSSRSVLITGESGVGKELIANCVHALSKRSGAFVSVNVAGLDDTLFTDSLFGHSRGAYTGAEVARAGLIRRAAKGTLFLDEIGDLDLNSQMRLLRVLQEAEYYPLGEDVPQKTDARIVVATQYDLEERMQAGAFRKDLYFRLNTHQLRIPPLRERMEDLPSLVDHFIEEAASSLNLAKPRAPLDFQTWLATYHFPGNVRELQNIVFDAVAQQKDGVLSIEGVKRLSEGQAGGKSSPQPECAPAIPGNGSPLFLDASQPFPSIKDTNRFLIREAMKRSGGNHNIAAELLGISRQTLYNRLKEDAPPA